MDAFIRIVRTLSIGCGVLAAFGLAAAVVIVCQMVIWRYVLNQSTVWQTEFVVYSLVAATLIGCPYVLLKRGHVNVDLLPHYLPHRGRVVLAVVAALISLVFCVLLAWTGWKLFHEALVNGWKTDSVWELPLWIVYLPLPVGIGLLSLQYIADIACLITGRDMPFGMRPDERP